MDKSKILSCGKKLRQTRRSRYTSYSFAGNTALYRSSNCKTPLNESKHEYYIENSLKIDYAYTHLLTRSLNFAGDFIERMTTLQLSLKLPPYLRSRD